MKAVLLAAGLGTRFGQGDTRIPKPMALVGGLPLLEHALLHVRSFGVREVFINLHYRPAVIKDYFGDGRKWGVEVRYSHEPRLLGTAGAVRNLARELDGTFIVYYTDNLCSFDLRAMASLHTKRAALATILVSESYDRLAGGLVECADDGRVLRFLEKPAGAEDGPRLENGGVYLLEPRVIDSIPAEGPSDFGRDVIPTLIRAGEPIYCHRAEGFVRGIDTPDRYRNLERALRGGALRIG
jgi:NDP-sugar pyrophosphorylase family protein